MHNPTRAESARPSLQIGDLLPDLCIMATMFLIGCGCGLLVATGGGL